MQLITTLNSTKVRNKTTNKISTDGRLCTICMTHIRCTQ